MPCSQRWRATRRSARDSRHSSGKDRRYRADPARAELRRLQRVRERQRGLSLDEAIAGVVATGSTGKAAITQSDRALADTLTSILYAAYLGDPEGPALNGGDVALRHELGYKSGVPPRSVGLWRPPIEEFRQEAGGTSRDRCSASTRRSRASP